MNNLGNRATRRSPAFKKAFRAAQANQNDALTPVAPPWPQIPQGSALPIEVWRSKTFLVVLYIEPGDHVRMTVNRASLDKNGKWAAEITWDELQEIKRQIGRAEQWAVEIFPPDSKIVNVSNMRHLWLLDSAPAFGW